MAQSKLKPQIVITTPIRQMFSEALDRIAINANRAFPKVAYSVIRELRGPIGAAIIRSPAIASISGGRLAGELGLPRSIQRATPKQITEAIVNSIGAVPIQVRRAGRNLSGGINITCQPADFRNIMGLGISPVKYQSKKYKRQVSLDWLDWLLFKGDKIIVSGYRVQRGSQGRSGLAKMKGKRGSMWRVDPAYSGSVDDNFITRALDDPIARNEILTVISKIVRGTWGGK